MTEREWLDGPSERSKKSDRWSPVPPLARHRHQSLSRDLSPRWEPVATSPVLRERAEAWRKQERNRERERRREREPIGRSEPEPDVELDLG
jgi:hypothetical protein